MFCRKGILKIFAKFTGKRLCRSLFFNKVAGLSLEHLWATASLTLSGPQTAYSKTWGCNRWSPLPYTYAGAVHRKQRFDRLNINFSKHCRDELVKLKNFPFFFCFCIHESSHVLLKITKKEQFKIIWCLRKYDWKSPI